MAAEEDGWTLWKNGDGGVLKGIYIYIDIKKAVNLFIYW